MAARIWYLFFLVICSLPIGMFTALYIVTADQAETIKYYQQRLQDERDRAENFLSLINEEATRRTVLHDISGVRVAITYPIEWEDWE